MLYPLKFKPILKDRIWGGERLAQSMGKKIHAGRKIGESWELSAVEGDLSVVSNGILKGNNIQEMVEIFMGDLVGESVYRKYGMEFPLLVKLIDAEEKLSLQVHPGDELAARRHHSYGKSELWYIIDAEPGAYIYLGFREDTSPEVYRQALEEGRLLDLLNRVEVKPGESFYIPAGTIHSIGEGILLAEIHQNSDITYRIYDWDRTDDDGNPRELHTELALDAINFSESRLPAIRIEPEPNQPELIKTSEYFTVNFLKVDNDCYRNYMNLDSFVIYFCLSGEINVEYSQGEESLARGEVILIPAQEEEIILKGGGDLLEIYIRQSEPLSN